MTEYHFTTPDLPNAEAKATLIMGLLQRQLEKVEPTDFDHTFFNVLAHYENQARKAGMANEQNPFLQLSQEVTQFLFQNAQHCLTANDAPTEFSSDVGRFRHMMKESVHQPGLVALAIRALKPLVERTTAPELRDFRGQVLTELGGAYLELQVEERAKAVRSAIGYLEEALTLRPLMADPLLHAETQYQLGNAYLQLPVALNERPAALQKAANAFDTARRIANAAEMYINEALCAVGQGTALALSARADEGDFLQGLTLIEFARKFFEKEGHTREQTLVQLRLATLWLSPAHLQPKAALEQLDLASRSEHLSEHSHLAIALQQVLAYLEIAGDTALVAAGETLNETMEWWLKSRSAQTNMQTATAMGPGWVHLLAPMAWTRLQAQISRIELDASESAQRQLAKLYVHALIASPGRGELFVSRALAAMRAACSTCSAHNSGTISAG